MDLFKACECGNSSRVHELIAQGVDVNSRNQDELTALHIAAINGHLDIVEILLGAGIDINAVDKNGYTALHVALLNKHDAMVELLLKKNPVINATAPNGATSLHTAAFNGHSDVVRFILDRGVAVDYPVKDGRTALHCAAQTGQADVVQLLLEKGADINAVDQSCYTALHWALLKKHDVIVELLLKKNPVINATAPEGWTSLHAAALNGHSDVVRFILDRGVAVDYPMKNGRTALHCAAQKGQADVVQLLLDRGASVHTEDRNKRTALRVAELHGHSDIVHLLLNKGAQPVLLDSILCGESIRSMEQIKTNEERTKFLCKIFGINRNARNFKFSYISKLCKVANFLYLQNLCATSITNILFLYQELKKLEWQHGIICWFMPVDIPGIDRHLSEGERFRDKFTMFIGTRNGRVAELNLTQCFKRHFNQSDMEMIDEYLQSEHEEVKIIAHAIKQLYINKELYTQLHYMVEVLAKSIRTSLLDQKLESIDHPVIKRIYPIVARIYEIFEYIQHVIEGLDKLSPGHYMLADKKASDQFYMKLNSTMCLIQESHVALEHLYKLICHEKDSLIASDRSIQCYIAENAVALPDTLHWTWRVESFDQYFSNYNKIKDGLMLGSAAVRSASSNSWIAEAVKAEEVRRQDLEKEKQAQQARKARRKAKQRQHASEVPMACPAPSPSEYSAQQIAPVESRSTKKGQKQETCPAPSPVDHMRQSSPSVDSHSVQQRPVNIAGYDKRVKRWFNTQFARAHNKHDVLYHSFSPCADTFIVQRGIRTPWQSNTHKQRINVLYSLPGEVIFPDGTHRFAIFTCCLDPSGFCYHRGITYKEFNEIEQIFQGAIPLDIDDHDDMKCSDPEKDTTYDESMASRVQGSLEKSNFFVKIHDAYNNVDIILYKLKKNPEQMH